MSTIFVFGSNELGIHGAGAAKVAKEKYGAVMGRGLGLWGKSYAIPTCKWPTGKEGFELSPKDLSMYITEFIRFAISHPELEFQVTQIGCGLAGWKPEEVAPLFAKAPKNCMFDTAWKSYLPEGTRYWGHV